MGQSFGVVPIGGYLRCRIQPVLNPFADRAKSGVLDREVIGERRRGLQVPGSQIAWDDPVPRLEIGKSTPGVKGAADHDRDEHDRRGPRDAKDPAAEQRGRR